MAKMWYLSVVIVAVLIIFGSSSKAPGVIVYKEENSGLLPIVLSGAYDVPYKREINDSVEYIFEFSNSEVSESKPARITLECHDSNRSYPVLVVVRQQKGVLSWQLPLIVESRSKMFEYARTSRTLCADNNYYLPHSTVLKSNPNEVIVSVSTSSPKNVTFSLQCPVFDLERNVQFEGYWQTVNTRGGITLTKTAFPSGFYVVFVVKGDDWDCSGNFEGTVPARNKTLTFSISPSITYHNYIISVATAFVMFAVFYVFSIVVSFVYFIKQRGNLDPGPLDDASFTSPQSPSGVPSSYGQIQTPSVSSEITSPDSIARWHSDSSLDETDIDMLQDADSDKNVFRTKTFLTVMDLARKNPRILRKKSQLYLWNLLTVAVFYALPVIQLVITYQYVLNQTGNQDLCYYNFLCAHPFGLLSDFNHVFSNIGYLSLGFLFIILTYRRDVMHRKSDPMYDKSHGIPQHYGLFYAMGAALMMEGVLSGCYHVCPNHSNFQFDTSFMYVISMMCMLKIYQTRHPDINASAYATFGVLAIVILVGMCGVLAGTVYFWVGFTIVHLVTCLHCHGERILKQPLMYILLSFASWGAALYFFFNKSISWELTPAQSKSYNQPCEIFNFYDKHDIWHFLSATSMFFSFMVLLTLDDDLISVHRSKIPVF
ncbi:SID1 transmembrane family member 1 [Blattella germanica]|nr:SID1 transmembrane family member 1 [Blattella germanica]